MSSRDLQFDRLFVTRSRIYAWTTDYRMGHGAGQLVCRRQTDAPAAKAATLRAKATGPADKWLKSGQTSRRYTRRRAPRGRIGAATLLEQFRHTFAADRRALRLTFW
jgi:hypothetical protein